MSCRVLRLVATTLCDCATRARPAGRMSGAVVGTSSAVVSAPVLAKVRTGSSSGSKRWITERVPVPVLPASTQAPDTDKGKGTGKGKGKGKGTGKGKGKGTEVTPQLQQPAISDESSSHTIHAHKRPRLGTLLASAGASSSHDQCSGEAQEHELEHAHASASASSDGAELPTTTQSTALPASAVRTGENTHPSPRTPAFFEDVDLSDLDPEPVAKAFPIPAYLAESVTVLTGSDAALSNDVLATMPTGSGAVLFAASHAVSPDAPTNHSPASIPVKHDAHIASIPVKHGAATSVSTTAASATAVSAADVPVETTLGALAQAYARVVAQAQARARAQAEAIQEGATSNVDSTHAGSTAQLTTQRTKCDNAGLATLQAGRVLGSSNRDDVPNTPNTPNTLLGGKLAEERRASMPNESHTLPDDNVQHCTVGVPDLESAADIPAFQHSSGRARRRSPPTIEPQQIRPSVDTDRVASASASLPSHSESQATSGSDNQAMLAAAHVTLMKQINAQVVLHKQAQTSPLWLTAERAANKVATKKSGIGCAPTAAEPTSVVDQPTTLCDKFKECQLCCSEQKFDNDNALNWCNSCYKAHTQWKTLAMSMAGLSAPHHRPQPTRATSASASLPSYSESQATSGSDNQAMLAAAHVTLMKQINAQGVLPKQATAAEPTRNDNDRAARARSNYSVATTASPTEKKRLMPRPRGRQKHGDAGGGASSDDVPFAGRRVDQMRMQGSTPLMLAAMASDTAKVQALLAAGAAIDEGNTRGETPLTIAATHGDTAMACLLIMRGAKVTCDGTTGKNALTCAALNGDVDMAQLLLRCGAGQTNPHSHINTSKAGVELAAAALGGHTSIVRLLHTHGADFAYTNKAGNSALGLAASRGHTPVVNLLLDLGAHVHLDHTLLEHANNEGMTALALAARFGHRTTVLDLLDRRANINGTDKVGNTVLALAAGAGRLEVVKLLVERGAAINQCNNRSEGALARAAVAGHVPVLEYLLRTGANWSATNCTGMTVLMLAAAAGHHEAVRQLLHQSFSVNKRNSQTGNTALIYAARSGHLETTHVLLRKGTAVDVNLKNSSGDTAMSLAGRNGHSPVEGLLLAYGADCVPNLKRPREATSPTRAAAKHASKRQNTAHAFLPQGRPPVPEDYVGLARDQMQQLLKERGRMVRGTKHECYAGLTRDQMKQLLKERGQTVRGTKHECYHRLINKACTSLCPLAQAETSNVSSTSDTHSSTASAVAIAAAVPRHAGAAPDSPVTTGFQPLLSAPTGASSSTSTAALQPAADRLPPAYLEPGTALGRGGWPRPFLKRASVGFESKAPAHVQPDTAISARAPQTDTRVSSCPVHLQPVDGNGRRAYNKATVASTADSHVPLAPGQTKEERARELNRFLFPPPDTVDQLPLSRWPTVAPAKDTASTTDCQIETLESMCPAHLQPATVPSPTAQHVAVAPGQTEEEREREMNLFLFPPPGHVGQLPLSSSHSRSRRTSQGRVKDAYLERKKQVQSKTSGWIEIPNCRGAESELGPLIAKCKACGVLLSSGPHDCGSVTDQARMLDEGKRQAETQQFREDSFAQTHQEQLVARREQEKQSTGAAWALQVSKVTSALVGADADTPASTPGVHSFTTLEAITARTAPQMSPSRVQVYTLEGLDPNPNRTAPRKERTAGPDTFRYRFIEFVPALAFARALQLSNRDAWRYWCKTGARPDGIPAGPERVWQHSGWQGWPHWLGSGKFEIGTPAHTFLPFNDAIAAVRALHIKVRETGHFTLGGQTTHGVARSQETKVEAQKTWYQWCLSGKRPPSVPVCPDRVYMQTGWQGWSHWLQQVALVPTPTAVVSGPGPGPVHVPTLTPTPQKPEPTPVDHAASLSLAAKKGGGSPKQGGGLLSPKKGVAAAASKSRIRTSCGLGLSKWRQQSRFEMYFLRAPSPQRCCV